MINYYYMGLFYKHWKKNLWNIEWSAIALLIYQLQQWSLLATKSNFSSFAQCSFWFILSALYDLLTFFIMIEILCYFNKKIILKNCFYLQNARKCLNCYTASMRWKGSNLPNQLLMSEAILQNKNYGHTIKRWLCS